MARRRRGTGSPQKEVRGGATRLLAHPAAFFSSRSGTSAEGRREEDGGGHPRSQGGARHLPPHLPPSLLAGRARRSVRPRCAGWCAMEGSRRSRGDAPWRGERTEQRRPLLRQDSTTGRSPPPSPAADRGPAATDRVLPGVEREGEEELRQWWQRQCR